VNLNNQEIAQKNFDEVQILLNKNQILNQAIEGQEEKLLRVETN